MAFSSFCFLKYNQMTKLLLKPKFLSLTFRSIFFYSIFFVIIRFTKERFGNLININII